MRITSIQATQLNLRFHPTVAPHMLRATTHRPTVTLYRLQLDNGAIGFGDDVGPPADLAAWVGRNAVDGLFGADHPGLEMACFDAVGRAMGVPVRQLLGRPVRQRVPFAYWTIDLPPAMLAAQVLHAASLGYTSYKFKCRPWWDPIEQMAAAQAVAPPGFHLWLDFNGHLRETRLALPILTALSEFDCVGGFESPIPQRDIEGYQRLRAAVKCPIVGHTGGGCCHVVSDHGYDPGVPWNVQLREQMFDGFVLGGSTETVRLAGTAHEFRKPFWVQHVGTALRAAWIAQLTSTCQQATLSHLAAHDLWAADVATAPRVVDGWITVPDGPGLGLEPDEAAIRALSAAPPTVPQRTISTVVYASRRRWHFADEQQRHEAFYFGHLPGFLPGTHLAVQPDDGSAAFADRHARCTFAPVVE